MRAASSAHNPGRRRGNVSKEGARAVQAVTDVLAEQGYEPRLQEGTLVLVNCPFDALAGEHSGLVCGMNLDLITAMLDELGYPELEVKFDPAPGRCCVTLVAST